MHTGILLAVEAVDVDEAFDLIEEFNSIYADWSDWNEAWGRWKSDFPNGALCHRDNPDKFMSFIDQYRAYTMNAMYEDLQRVGSLTVWELVMLKANRSGDGFDDPAMVNATRKLGKDGTASSQSAHNEDFLNVYRTTSLLELVSGDFTSGQHFFDVTAHTPNKDAVLKRVAQRSEDQWLIVWDYHY